MCLNWKISSSLPTVPCIVPAMVNCPLLLTVTILLPTGSQVWILLSIVLCSQHINGGFSFCFIAVNTSNGGATVTDPNGNTSGGSGSNQSGGNSSGGGGLPKAGIIGICVGVGVAVYAAATIVGVKVYRKRRAKKDEEIREQHMVFAQSISSPIMQGNSLGWVPAPYQQHQTPRNRQY